MIKNSLNKEQIEKKLLVLQKNKNKSKYWNITSVQGIFLSNLIELKSPKNILEIGTSNGFSTLYLAKSSPEESKIYTVEVDESRFLEAKSNFASCGLKNIVSINDEAINFLKSFKGIKFDFIFVDAGHCLYQEILSLIEEKNLMGKHGILIFDNVLSHTSLKDFTMNCQKKFESELIDIGGGLLVLYYF